MNNINIYLPTCSRLSHFTRYYLPICLKKYSPIRPHNKKYYMSSIKYFNLPT